MSLIELREKYLDDLEILKANLNRKNSKEFAIDDDFANQSFDYEKYISKSKSDTKNNLISILKQNNLARSLSNNSIRTKKTPTTIRNLVSRLDILKVY